MATTFEFINPENLKNHPLNAEIYADVANGEFLERVRLAGKILEPIRILGKGSPYPEGTIISGHRRMQAARQLKFSKVPVVVERDLMDKLEIDEQVILSNDQRDKTDEQIGKEASALLRIEQERAAIRMKSGKKLDPSAEPREGQEAEATGKAIEIVADKIGLGEHKTKQLIEVTEAIEEAEEKGHNRKAEEIRETLNTKSVAAAHKLVEGDKPKKVKEVKDDAGEEVPKELQKLFAMRPQFDAIESLQAKIQENALEISRVVTAFRAKPVELLCKQIFDLFSKARPGHAGCAKAVSVPSAFVARGAATR